MLDKPGQAAVVFPTTYSFTTTSGFALPNGIGAAQQHSGKLGVGVVVAGMGGPATPFHPNDNRPPAVVQHGFVIPSGLTAATANAAPYAAKQHSVTDTRMDDIKPQPSVGWRGLLEASRASSCMSGILGAQSMDTDSAASPAGSRIEICCTAHATRGVKTLVQSVIRGLKALQEPEKALDGMGGTYFFLNDSGRKCAIVKPCDEEPLAPCNPKGYVGRQLGDPGWKPTVRVGEAAMREVAAYLLDHDRFARVPHTVLVSARHPIFHYLPESNTGSSNGNSGTDASSSSEAISDGCSRSADSDSMLLSPHDGVSGSQQCTPLPMKLGSLQEFVAHEGDTSEMGTSRFNVSDVHRIGILDIRLYNTDRHAGNILVRKPSSSASSASLRTLLTDSCYQLIPIDHGFCLPEALEGAYFEWLHWPQAMLPFDEEELRYIRELDTKRDIELLRQELPTLRPACLRVLEVSTLLLKAAASAGLSLAEIGAVMSRPSMGLDEEPSELEKICQQACDLMQARMIGSNSCTSIEECLADEDRATAEEEGGADSSCIDEDSDAELAAVAEATLEVTEPDAMCYMTELGPGGCLVASPVTRARDHLLFDLDDDSAGYHPVDGGAVMRRSAPKAVAVLAPHLPHSPFSQLSLDSNASSQEQFLLLPDGVSPLLPVSPSVSAGGAVAGALATPTSIGRLLPAREMARSVHTADGFLWRGVKGRGSMKRHSKARVTKAYPPPVLTMAPASVNDVFSKVDEARWEHFVGVLMELIDGALASGVWRQGASAPGGVAMSCPRF